MVGASRLRSGTIYTAGVAVFASPRQWAEEQSSVTQARQATRYSGCLRWHPQPQGAWGRARQPLEVRPHMPTRAEPHLASGLSKERSKSNWTPTQQPGEAFTKGPVPLSSPNSPRLWAEAVLLGWAELTGCVLACNRLALGCEPIL